MSIAQSPSPEPTSEVRRAVQMVLVTALVGIGVGGVMGFVSYGFVRGVHALSEWREQSEFAVVNIGKLSLAFGPMLILLVAAMLVLALRRFISTPHWHGPPESIYAAHLATASLDTRAGLASTLAAFISASGGASVGQYGPLVHFGATIGSLLRHRIGAVISVDVFIGCGVAGAIAAGFNAPIAGVVFAHEAILRHFSFRAIAPIVISSITAAWVRDYILGGAPLFVIDGVTVGLAGLLPLALLVGPLFVLLAVLYMRSLHYSARLAARTGWSASRRIIMAALMTGVIALFVPEVLGLGTAAMQGMLDGQFGGADLAILILAKLVATAICLGFGFAGGLFLPAMFIGLGAGAIASRLLAGTAIMGAGSGLAICGMAAVGAAVIGAPIAAVLIVLEITASYPLAVAAMVSIVTAISVSNLLFGSSYFDRLLRDRGVDMTRGRGHVQMMHARIDALVSDAYAAVSTKSSIADAHQALRAVSTTECYLVDGEGVLRGKLTLSDMIDADPSDRAHQHASEGMITIPADASLQDAIEKASHFVGESLPVIDPDTGRLCGVVTEGALFRQYLALQNQVTSSTHS